MGSIVPIRATGGLTRGDPKRVQLFAKTVGKDLRGPEIDEALEWCELYGANPFTRDIYFFVFDADRPTRRVVPVLGIGLCRKIAARSGNYRPDAYHPRFAYDEAIKGPANPTGMVWCEVTVYMHSHGGWHPITSRLKWDERAPLIEGGVRWVDTGEVWPDTGKPKRKKVVDESVPKRLDPDKRNWHTMPETMMAKCCEADAIRKGWPAETSGSYVEGELDQAHTLELTATEIIETAEAEQRAQRIGGAKAVTIDWCDGKPLDRIPDGQFADRVMAWMSDKDRTAGDIRVLADRNKIGFAEFWSRNAADALELKKAKEARLAELDRHESSP